MISNNPTNKKHYLQSREGAVKKTAAWWHKSPGTTPLSNGLYMWLKDTCRHSSFSYLRLGKLLPPPPSPPARVLLYHVLVPPFSSLRFCLQHAGPAAEGNEVSTHGTS